MSETEKKYNLRLPDWLYDKLQLRADKNRRSMNNEIVIILERHIESKETISTIDNRTTKELPHTGYVPPGDTPVNEITKGGIQITARGQRPRRSELKNLNDTSDSEKSG